MASIQLPDGLIPTDHNSTVGTIIRLNAAFVAVIAIIISVRLYVRLRVVRRLGSDDILMVFAALFTSALCGVCIGGTKFGLGRHEWDLDQNHDPTTIIDSTSRIVKTLFVCQVLYATAVTLTKASIIASYLRVLPTPIFRKLMYATAALIVAMWVCSVFVTIFQCDPIAGAWDITLQKKKCVNILAFFYVSSSVNILTDLVLCTAPLPLFWRLEISIRERVILCMLFGTGVFATAASAVRLSQLHNVENLDSSYACVSSLNWSVVEVGTGIICASIPSLKPLLVRILPGRFFTLQRGSSRLPSRHDQTITQTSERGSYMVEMGSYRQAGTGLQKAGIGLRPQLFSVKSMSTHGSAEEHLVSAESRDHNLSSRMAR